ncbi:HYES hydrolase, partial [Aramus guarauna]|nr:HYES hydrolase [Aramus guarauna]
MARRAVLFDLGGVLFGPGLQHFLGSCERDCALPRDFLRKVLFAGGSESPYAKAMRGQITLSQLFSEMEEGCRQNASASGIALPPNFSVARAFEEMAAEGTVSAPLLRAARVLRRNGFKTCVLTNNWVDDSAGRLFTATLMNLLRRHFDLVIESCRLGARKPDPEIYAYALDALRVKPQEVILLDDIGENLKPAREMGMATVLVRDTETVLRELEELSGVQARLGGPPPRPLRDPRGAGRDGLGLLGLAAMRCWCWTCGRLWKGRGASLRRCFRGAAAGARAHGPPSPQGIPQTVLVGHDWGGAVVWNMALFYPERVRIRPRGGLGPWGAGGGGGLASPVVLSCPPPPPLLPVQGVAEAELEKDIGRTLKVLIRSTHREDRLPLALNFHRVRERGGLLVGFPETPPASRILHGPELQYYIQRFEKSGFSGPLNWYRNMRPNWRWALAAKDRKITMPALMVTAGKDAVLHPSMSRGMEQWIPQLRREHLEECGHWTQMERPAALNRILVEWLEGLPPDPPLPKISRL